MVTLIRNDTHFEFTATERSYILINLYISLILFHLVNYSSLFTGVPPYPVVGVS